MIDLPMITLDHFVSITFEKPHNGVTMVDFAPGLISKDFPDVDLLWPHALENAERVCGDHGCRLFHAEYLDAP